MEPKPETNLAGFNNSWYKPGRGFVARGLWFVTQAILFGSWLPGSSWRRLLLRLFGASIGKKVVLKPGIHVKYPWNLSIGDYSWIGENVWIDNLGKVRIAENCCVSQGALLLCGNHNYKKPSFDLMVGNITLERGVWIGAKALVCPDVVCLEHSILTAQSTATQSLEARSIYSGNPAQKVRERVIES